MPSAASEQVVQGTNVYVKSIFGRGNATFSSKDVKAKSQLMFVAKPLIVALETAKLSTTCYSCLQSTGESGSPFADLDHARNLKRCSGCKVVKFCDQHKAGLLAEGEWKRLLALEDHQDQLRREGGERWEDLMLMAQGIKSYSGSEQSLELILRLICILTVNSFTLTSQSLDSLGLALHPSTALLNHSCDPNAFVRFDISLASQQSGFFGHGSIAIHALRDISENEEITLSYTDNTLPVESRQAELMERYFFKCSCNLCAKGSNTSRDNLHKTSRMLSDQESYRQGLNGMRVGIDAIKMLLDIQSHPGMEQTRVDDLIRIMGELAGAAVWPLYRYPWPQLRHLLLLGLLSSDRLWEALLQSAILMRAVYPVLYEQRHHPIRMAQMWVLWNICLYCLQAGIRGEGSIDEANSKFRMLGLLHCELIEVISRYSREGTRINGAFEHSIDQAWVSLASRSGFWAEYREKKEAFGNETLFWLDSQIRGQLQKEGVSQEIVDLSLGQRERLTPG
ncbi:hypothetical protein LTR10_013055 [Elasticomyces elasticus]|uniref:SET domain-containing protein n=1 Tax=Exophiala sideris TaxID=1016849 RepID=A0ABR0JB04_9EURO|nr:hypothetical protein LTR10_013055 [Elasticomyces elasticus]KAK5030431.1 hypothetical protein LTS07_005215 [Exophiala sideris]KAK5038484.1 hypothetical protein LTR13_004231 [Exophiala sideris]KAK5060367.1 hypothetical protein LTR69_005684 [Exophiala sideris]KAK5183277.1 hypothetical protein LTR44_004278 [Eurotiomycetes sp. CCFEE 6388]